MHVVCFLIRNLVRECHHLNNISKTILHFVLRKKRLYLLWIMDELLNVQKFVGTWIGQFWVWKLGKSVGNHRIARCRPQFQSGLLEPWQIQPNLSCPVQYRPQTSSRDWAENDNDWNFSLTSFSSEWRLFYITQHFNIWSAGAFKSKLNLDRSYLNSTGWIVHLHSSSVSASKIVFTSENVNKHWSTLEHTESRSTL